MLQRITRDLWRRSVFHHARFSSSLASTLQHQLNEFEQQGTYKSERVITSPQSALVTVDTKDTKGMEVINFCANNYLGLANDPRVKEAAKDAIDSHGFGLASVRFICGTQDIHKELEGEISRFHGMDDAVLFPSCFDANAALFEAILGPEDAVISDELNHASIIDGIRLCKAKRLRFKHMDMEDLTRSLEEARDCRIKLIATDGVFSMDGDVAPLDQICDIAEKHNAYVFIDECHATGFFGKTGKGTIEHCGVEGRVHIINSTLGKALGGGTGGYTAASKEVVDMLRQKGRPYLFSNSVAPAVVGASLKVFEILQSSGMQLSHDLKTKTNGFRSKLTEAGFELRGDFDHPIVPIMLGDARLAAQFAEAMLQRGIYVIGFSYPVVPMGLARIRTQLSAAHTAEQIESTVAAFVDVGKELGVI